VIKCLEKDRNRRYETANGLARDIERYLHDEPVQACPPSAWYRFRKFARRHKAALGMATALGLGLLLAVAVLAISNTRIGRALTAETKAKEELEEAVVRERSNLYQYALGLARRDWVAGDLDQAQRNLQACPLEFRDKDWFYLHRVCHAELLCSKQSKSAGSTTADPESDVRIPWRFLTDSDFGIFIVRGEPVLSENQPCHSARSLSLC
jgi:hypothetical protein